MSKISLIILIFSSVKIIGLGEQLIIKPFFITSFFEIVCFLKLGLSLFLSTHDQVSASPIKKIFSRVNILGKTLHLFGCATLCAKSEVILMLGEWVKQSLTRRVLSKFEFQVRYFEVFKKLFFCYLLLKKIREPTKFEKSLEVNIRLTKKWSFIKMLN